MDCLKVYALALSFIGSVIASGCSRALSLPPDDSTGAPKTFVAVGADGTILSSRDGARWTAEESGVSANLSSVATGRASFVAVGRGGAILSSPDGVSWTRRSSPTTVELQQVIFNGDKFVAVGGSWSSDAVTVKSSDGITWTQVESPSNYSFHAVAYGRDTLVVAAYTPSNVQPMGLTPVLFTSAVSSGSSVSSGWSQQQGPDFTDSVTVGDEIVLVGSAGGGAGAFRSRDGVTWTTNRLPTFQAVTGIAFSGSTFVVVGQFATILTSSNGADWSQPPTTLGIKMLQAVTHGSSTFVVVGQDGVIVTSADGTTWMTQEAGTTKNLTDIAYGPIRP